MMLCMGRLLRLLLPDAGDSGVGQDYSTPVLLHGGPLSDAIRPLQMISTSYSVHDSRSDSFSVRLDGLIKDGMGNREALGLCQRCVMWPV